MATPTYVAENDAERERLRALIARLSDGDLGRSIGHGWTVSAALAHLAYWDRRNLSTIEEWERNGVRVIQYVPDSLNDELLPGWLAMPPRQAAADALAAAEAVDSKVAGLPAGLVDGILAQRPRTLIRAIHRREHLGEIERALAT